MAADAQEISKVDSAVSGLSTDDKHVPAKKRTSSSAAGVMNINDLGMLTIPFLDVTRVPFYAVIRPPRG